MCSETAAGHEIYLPFRVMVPSCWKWGEERQGKAEKSIFRLLVTRLLRVFGVRFLPGAEISSWKALIFKEKKKRKKVTKFKTKCRARPRTGTRVQKGYKVLEVGAFGSGGRGQNS